MDISSLCPSVTEKTAFCHLCQITEANLYQIDFFRDLFLLFVQATRAGKKLSNDGVHIYVECGEKVVMFHSFVNAIRFASIGVKG